MTHQYVCIHGHFYQPPRENAWLEAIESQDSAHPYHDWNERIASECYAANATSRILDPDGYIIDIVNNYARMSFNFGPTLLSWLESNDNEAYQAILAADKKSADRFDGHGSAMAQAYNHMILPLANRRDKQTQIHWGIHDFEYRFGRPPEGMWLPETAVDIETLEIMAQYDLRFVLLSPNQAEKVKYADNGDWLDVSDGSINALRPYRQELPSGRSIAVFFYHGELSHAVAFEQLPADGDHFVDRLVSGFAPSSDQAQLVHVCSDGETYGHHQYRGDMGLAYALHRLDESDQVELINYGAYLEKHPPEDEVQIKEYTSWSCYHGVERWRSDCGCNSGGKPGWHQKWRQPLRQALDALRDAMVSQYEAAAADLLQDPWGARDAYIDVVLHRVPKAIEDFFKTQSKGALSATDRVKILKLLELQRNAMLMYTSCGWFFDDISGIETVQIIQYAARVLQLAGSLFGRAPEEPFLKKLSEAPSNLPEHQDGKQIYEKWVRPAAVNLADVGAHYAISALFRDYAESTTLYSFQAKRRAHHTWEAGRAKLSLGRVEITSKVTWESMEFCYAVLHFGDHNISCGLQSDGDMGNFLTVHKQIVESFKQADFPSVIQQLDQRFSSPLYSMKSLFRDDQRAILRPILDARVHDAMALFRTIYEPNVPLMRFLKGTNSLTPKALTVVGEMVVNQDLKEALSEERLDHPQIRELMEQAQLSQIPLDEATLEYTLRLNIQHQNSHFSETPTWYEILDDLTSAVELVYDLPFHVVLRRVQNTYFKVCRQLRSEYVEHSQKGDSEAKRWLERFDQLGEKLLVRP